VTVLTVVGFSVAVAVTIAVADSSYLVVAERLEFRTDTREHTIGLDRRALSVDLHVAPPSSDVGVVAELDHSL